MQFALVSLVKKMAIDHPYHTIFQVHKLYSFCWSEAYYMAYGFHPGQFFYFFSCYFSRKGSQVSGLSWCLLDLSCLLCSLYLTYVY